MKLLFAGGGTAGHVEPSLAVARAVRVKYPDSEISFIGTAEGLEMSLVPAAGFKIFPIEKVSISRRLSPSLLKVPFQLVKSILQTTRLLKGVDCAVGFGGYVSAPLYCAALITRVPIVIHEQNAKPGWANRIGAKFTPHTAISYPVRSGALSRAELTGLPLRADVLAALTTSSGDWLRARREAKKRIAESYQLDTARPLIFIFGGSQGSLAINRVIDESRKTVEASGYSILHGVGKKNEVAAPSLSYRALGYIEEMADCYLAADVLISRSGAVTCAEARALSRYNLFIPLPIGNGEQALNAASLVEDGRAEVLPQEQFTSSWLISNIDRLIEISKQCGVEGDPSGAVAVDKILAIVERAIGDK